MCEVAESSLRNLDVFDTQDTLPRQIAVCPELLQIGLRPAQLKLGPIIASEVVSVRNGGCECGRSGRLGWSAGCSIMCMLPLRRETVSRSELGNRVGPTAVALGRGSGSGLAAFH
jgi:hypothetical protein